MILTIVLILGFSAYEIYQMVKKNQKQEIFVLVGLILATVSLAIYYKLDNYSTSLSILIFRLFGIEY